MDTISTAPDVNDQVQCCSVTHPFHPLFGEKIQIVALRQNWGEDRVFYRETDKCGYTLQIDRLETFYDRPEKSILRMPSRVAKKFRREMCPSQKIMKEVFFVLKKLDTWVLLCYFMLKYVTEYRILMIYDQNIQRNVIFLNLLCDMDTKMVFCGIDIGTTNAKGIALDQRGNVLLRVTIANPDGCADVFWYKHFADVMDKFQSDGAFATDKIYCSVTSQGGSFVLVDEKLRPVSNLYLWTESQSGHQAAESYIEEYGGDGFYRTTGWTANAWLPVFKLKGIDKRTYDRIVFVPDFIYGQLTGKLVTDITNAQITGLCDFQNKMWDDGLVKWAQIDKAALPEICDSLRVICSDLQTRWGNLNLVTSSHDQYAAMNAVSLEVDRDIMLASGTAWVVNSRRRSAVYDVKAGMLHPGRNIAADNYGNISVVGDNLGKGFHDMLCLLGVDYGQLERLEAQMELVSIPTKAFDFSEHAAGQDKPLLIKRYMEWMACVVRKHFIEQGFMRGLEEIVLTGGAANSKVLPQVLANVCGIRVKTVVFPELTAFGAAKFAAQAGGIEFEKSIDDISICRSYFPVDTELYRKWYDLQINSM